LDTNEELVVHRKDKTLQVTMQDGSVLIVHIEHQSTPEFMMLIRFLYYAAGIMEPYIREHKKAPLLIQILLYHGDRAPYPYQTTLQAYYDHPKWSSQELTFRFYLVDLTQLSDAALLKDGHCAPLEILLKHGRDSKFELPAAAYRKVFQECLAATDDSYLSSIFEYIASLEKEVGKEVYQFIQAVFTNKTAMIMTYGEQLVQQGVQQGMQTRNWEIARTMLHNLHLGVDVVEQATRLSKQDLAGL
ncbi:MAG: Rpn family recombination-promoting nuclease/putative transposase, partial [Bacteroidota bacterium]